MKLAGFVLLLSGWGLVMAALVLLATPVSRTAFVIAGVGVEIVGMVLAVRSHMPVEEEQG